MILLQILLMMPLLLIRLSNERQKFEHLRCHRHGVMGLTAYQLLHVVAL